ncbi:MAG: polyisoprenoid-binding protein [Sphingobacteriales bacterium]|nr:MAG: polyisoprenoid-binding protein [Sphingobacteriales bacterium]
MLCKPVAIVSILLLNIMSFNAFAQKIDAGRSYAKFNVSKLGFSNVSGTFKGMEGRLAFDPEDMSHSMFDVCIKAATVNTGEEDRDHHLKEKDFFYVKKYPKICFKSTSMLKTKSGYLVTGQLTIKGKGKLVNIPFTYTSKTFKGNLKVNRKDFDLNDGTGMFTIGETVDIEIYCIIP